MVLVQRDAGHSLAAEKPEEAIAKARAIVAERLAATAENPSAAGQIRRPRARFGKTLPGLIVGLAHAGVVVVALLARARR